jgi:hypothetical protein
VRRRGQGPGGEWRKVNPRLWYRDLGGIAGVVLLCERPDDDDEGVVDLDADVGFDDARLLALLDGGEG